MLPRDPEEVLHLLRGDRLVLAEERDDPALDLGQGLGVEVEAFLDADQALAVDRPTVIQLALDRAWVSPDQPAT